MHSTLRLAHFSHKAVVLSSVGLMLLSSLPAHAEEFYPNDPYFSEQWYMRQIGAPEAWAVTHGSDQVTVAVIDGGVDITQPDLADNIWTNPGEIANDGLDNDGNGYIDDVHGWNFVEGSPDVMPMAAFDQSDIVWSHGTITSSLIAAKGDNDYGIAGMAWNVKIMPVVVLDAYGFGSQFHIAKAIDYAIDQGADIINLSLFGFEDSEDVRRSIQRAKKRGVLVVAAVGNDYIRKEGTNVNDYPTTPACSEFERDDVLGVAGTDVLDQHAAYTNIGDHCTDISAPADAIIADHPVLPPPMPATEEDGVSHEVIRNLGGTSLSTPLVSGSAALVKSLRPEWSGTDIYHYLLSTSDAISGSKQLDDPGYLGQGRLDIGRAIRSLNESPLVGNAPLKHSTLLDSSFLSQLVDLFPR